MSASERLGLLGGFRRVLLGLGDQLLDLLTALVADLLVKVRAVLFFDDLAAFLADRLVEFGPVTLARRLTPLAADLLVKSRPVAVADRVSAFFTGLPYRHFAVDLVRLRRCLRLLGVGHASAGRFSCALELLSTLSADFLVERRAVLALRRLAALAADRFVELGAVLRLDP